MKAGHTINGAAITTRRVSEDPEVFAARCEATGDSYVGQEGESRAFVRSQVARMADAAVCRNCGANLAAHCRGAACGSFQAR